MENLMQKFTSIKDIEENVDGETEKIIYKKRKTLKKSIHEGSASSFSQGLSQHFLTPFALAIKSSPFQIGILSAFSGLVPLSQLIGAKLMRHNSRKKIVLKFVLLQSLMWIPIALLSFLYWKGLFLTSLPTLLICLFTIAAIFGGIAHPSWFSWMGDLVPPQNRGKYFGIRNLTTGIFGLTAMLLGAILLKAFDAKQIEILGFGVLFIFAFIFRFASYRMFKTHYVPKLKIEKGSNFSLISFLRRYDNYGKFAIYNGAFYFTLMIASPFFMVYMIKELNFGPVAYTAVIMSSSIFYLIFTPLMGKLSDKFGNLKLFYVSNFLFVLTPLPWFFFKTPIALIFIPQLLAGLANASFTLASTNFTYDAVKPQKRGTAIAYTSVIGGIGIFLGSITGGYLIKYFTSISINPFFAIFAIAMILRFVVGILFLPRLKEEKIKVKRFPPMHLELSHPFKTIHNEIGWVKRIFR